VGGPLLDMAAVTVVVNVTGWPNTDGLDEEVISVVVVGAETLLKSIVPPDEGDHGPLIEFPSAEI